MTAESIGERHIAVLAKGEEAGLLIRLRMVGEREGLGAGRAHPDHQATMLGVAVAVRLAGRLERLDELSVNLIFIAVSLSLLAKFLAQQLETGCYEMITAKSKLA